MNNEDRLKQYLESVALRKEALRKILKDILQTDKTFKTLEIGSGHGDFLVQYAQNFPERFCVGIDLITQRIAKSNRKANRANLTNVTFIKARAEEVLECQPEDFLWNEVIVLYPDPWPKNRHHKNRLFQVEFLSQLAQRVVPGAKIHFETDSLPYFEETCQRIDAHPNWHPITCESYIVNTVFSRLTGQQGHHAVFERR